MKDKISTLYKFLNYDIWRVKEGEVPKIKYSFYTVIKVIALCVNRFIQDKISSKASALTYSTLLAIVPMIAILFAIARGFGFDNVIQESIESAFSGQKEAANIIFSFVESYLTQTKNGLFVGVGLIMLLWTVLNLINTMEISFNQIWNVKNSRSIYRIITDYFSMLLLMPILMVVSSGISIFMTTAFKSAESFILIGSLIRLLVSIIPYVLTWCMFTALYIFTPNTKVKFKYALIAGIIAGTAYQYFQYLYINGQMSVSRYNAIYGSFAALPLFLFWVQVSWMICLTGAEMTFVAQNMRNYSFDKDTRRISRRFHDFVTLLIMTHIANRFKKHLPPYTAESLSNESQVPYNLTSQILYQLQEIGLIHAVATEDGNSSTIYQTSVDVHTLTVGKFFSTVESYGSENFKMESKEVQDIWKRLQNGKQDYYDSKCNTLLVDLITEEH